jgi:hypothetical protein
MGGPLFWPILVGLFGFVGLVVGLLIRRKPNSKPPKDESPNITNGE